MPQSHTTNHHSTHHEEETQKTNSHMIARRQKKQSNQFSLPQRDDHKTRKDTTYSIMKQEPHTKLPYTMRATINNESTATDHRLRTDSSGGYVRGGLNAFNWRKISVIDSVVVVKTQNCLAHMGDYLCNALL